MRRGALAVFARLAVFCRGLAAEVDTPVSVDANASEPECCGCEKAGQAGRADGERHLAEAADSFATLAEVYGRGRYAPFTRAARIAAGLPVALVRFAQPAGDFPDPPTADYTLAVNERGAGTMWFDIGTGRRELRFAAGDMVLKPPGVATMFGVDHPHQKSFVSIPATLVHGILEEAGVARRDFGALHEGTFRAAAPMRLLDLMWSEAAPESAHGRLFGDGALLALVGSLLRLADTAGSPGSAPGALAPARVARVRDWIMAHLAEPIDLAGMAEAACLSRFHFSRSFKAATGLSPRAYVMACRIEQARAWLEKGDMPIAAIAQACGFADQSHFSAAFVRTMGVPPGRYRRSRR